MTQFDHDLKSALSADDAAFLEDLDARDGLMTHITSTFQGPMGWVAKSAIALGFVFTGLMVWTAWEAFGADTDRLTILWSAGFVAALICQGLIKIWLYNRANTLSVLRALKRMELRMVQNTER